MAILEAPQGYSLGKCISASGCSEVYGAVRDSDGRAVVLKAYTCGSIEEGEPWARLEFDALRRAAGAGIPEAFERRCVGERPVLVLDRVGGSPLHEWVASAVPDARATLDVAIALAEILARLHEARLVHRGLMPSNVLVDPVTRRTHLIDFALARPLGSAARDGHAAGAPRRPSSFRYVAPEQTGRTDGGVDPRSDLYSLGATLYFAFTGRPPFPGDDAQALIHAHMAMVPAPARELRPELPEALSRIVGKLLEKMPEDRYQTAHALHRDLLQCREQWLHTGSIAPDLALASADAPHRPVFSKRLYGRQHAVAALLENYEAAATAGLRVLAVSGAAGTGKSALMNELRASLARTNGYLAMGKFDPYRRELPFAGLLHAFETLAQQFLTEADEHLEYWRAGLRAELGALARVLTDLVPELQLVLGETAPVPALEPRATLARLGLAVQRLLRAVARAEHPLVLFLDNVQWADAGTWELLRELLLKPQELALLVVAAYREGDVDSAHPLAKLFADLAGSNVPVHMLALGPLGTEECAQMLADALGRSAEQTRSLAACVSVKTGNTPLLIQQFVHHAYDVGLIRFEPGSGWTWDEAEIAAAGIADDAVGLMTAKIERLPRDTAEVLQLASCAGNAFDVATLAALTTRPRDQLEAALFALCDKGLLAPDRGGFRFVHDRVREAAQALLSAPARARLHLEAARLLRAHTPAAELDARAFEIADHLAQARAEIAAADALGAAEIHVRAGNRALRSGAATAAAQYFAAARSLYRTEHWSTHAALGIEIHLQSAECAYQMGDSELALRMLGALEHRSLSTLQRALLACKRIYVFSLSRPNEETLQLARRTLREFGVRWPARPSRLRIRLTLLRTDLGLRRGLGADLFAPAGPGDHSSWYAPVLIGMAAAGAVAGRRSAMNTLLSCYALRMYRRHGYITSPALALASYAAARITALGHLGGAEQLAQAALEWSARVPTALSDHRVEHVAYALVFAWTRPRRSVLEPLGRIEAAARELGDVQFAFYTLGLRTIYGALCGDPLPKVARSLAAFMHQLRFMTSAPPDLWGRVFRLFSADAGSDPGDEVAELDTAIHKFTAGFTGIQVLWISYLCMLGHYARAYEFGLDEELWRFGGPMQSHHADLLFFLGTAAAALADRGGAAARRRCRRALRRCERDLRRLAKGGPDFVHMATGLGAERARLAGRLSAAAAAYAESCRRALAQGYVHHAAFLQERRAQLLVHMRRTTEAAQALDEAASLYTRWGAPAKAKALRPEIRSLQ